MSKVYQQTSVSWGFFFFFSYDVGSRPDLSHHRLLFSCQSSCGEILTGPSTARLTLTLPRPQQADNTVYSVLSQPVKVGQVTAQSEVCQHTRKLLCTHTHTIHARTFICTHLIISITRLLSCSHTVLMHTCRHTDRRRYSHSAGTCGQLRNLTLGARNT